MLEETKITEVNDYIVSNGNATSQHYLNQFFVNHNKEEKIQSNEDKGPEDLRTFIAGEPFLPLNVMPHDKNNGQFYPPHPSYMPFMPASHCPNMFPMLFPLHPSLMHPLLPPAQFIFPHYNPTMHSPLTPMLDKNDIMYQNRDVQVNDINKIPVMSDDIIDKHQERNEISYTFAPTSLNSSAIPQSNANFPYDLNATMFERVSNEYTKYMSSFPAHYSTMQTLQPLPLNAFLPSYNPLMIPPSAMPVLGSFYSIPHPFLGQNLVGNPNFNTMRPDHGNAKDIENEEEDAKCRQEVASLFKNEKTDEKLSPRYISNNFVEDNSDIAPAAKPFVDLNNNVLSEQITYQDNENFNKYREVSKLKQRKSKELNGHIHLNENGAEENDGDNVTNHVTGAEPGGAEEERLHKRMRVISLTQQDENANPTTTLGPAPPTADPPVVRTGDDRIFRKGSLIHLQNGDTRLVEQLTTKDFAKSCGVDPDYDIVKGEVLSIDRRPLGGSAPTARGEDARTRRAEECSPTAKITLAIRDRGGLLKEDLSNEPPSTPSSPPSNTRVTNMEVRLSHLFFVPQPNNVGGGWASVSPERSLSELGLRCNQLRPGDDCLVVLAKNKNLLTRHCSGSSGGGGNSCKPVVPPRAAPCKIDRVVHGNHYDRLLLLKAKSRMGRA